MSNKTLIKMVVTTCAIILLAFAAFPAFAEHIQGMYPRTTIVTELDYEHDMVIMVDGAGELWSMKGINDWELGDIVSLLMYNNGTPKTIYDDTIALAYFSGFTCDLGRD